MLTSLIFGALGFDLSFFLVGGGGLLLIDFCAFELIFALTLFLCIFSSCLIN